MQRAGAILQHVLEKYSLTPVIHEHRVHSRWSEVFGPAIVAHAIPLRLRRGTLTVKVDHPTWLYELTMLKSTMIKSLNDDLGYLAVNDIHFTL